MIDGRTAAADPRPIWMWFGIAVLFGGLGWLMTTMILQGERSIVLALAVAVAVGLPALALAWFRPIVFPLGAYVAMIPFDNLAQFGSVTSATRLLGAVSALALAVAIIRRRQFLKPGRAVYAWAATILWIVLSGLWALDGSVVPQFVLAYLQLFGLFAVVAMYPMTRDDYLIMVAAAVGGGFLAAGAGAILFSHGQESHGRLVLQVAGRVVDENHNAAALIVPFAFALMAALRERQFFRQVALACIAAIIAYGIILTASRGGFLAMVTVVVMLLLRSRYKLELMLGFIAVGAVASASALSKRVDSVVSSGGAGRFEIWSSAWQAFKEHWLLGVGVGNFQEAYDSVYMDVYHPSYTHWHIVAHDLLAQTGVELGIIGIVLVAIAWIASLRDPSGSWRNDPFSDWWRAAQAGCAGILCSALFVD
ncbi:MAG: O-antigen ligase family protein, partial [Candidatus Velthaea sp.]